MKPNHKKELIIIGAGPAGLKAAEEAGRLGLDYLLLEKGRVGQAWSKVRPKMRLLSPNHPQRDWTSLSSQFPIWKLPVKRPYCTAAEFTTYLRTYAEYFRLQIKEHCMVDDVTCDGEYFMVHTAENTEYRARFLFVATGIFGNPYFPEIPGIKDNPHVMHSHDYFSAEPFKGKKVMIVGAGNSAAEIATQIVGRSIVYLVTRSRLKYFAHTHKLYHIRGITESFLRELISMEMVRYRPNREIRKIEGGLVLFDDWKIKMDMIIFATGYRPNLSILEKLNITFLKNRYPQITGLSESRQYPNLFFGGPLASHSDSAITIHGFLRYVVRAMEEIARRSVKK